MRCASGRHLPAPACCNFSGAVNRSATQHRDYFAPSLRLYLELGMRPQETYTLHIYLVNI